MGDIGPVARIRQLGGVARWVDVVEGTSQARALESAVDDGRVSRVGRGTYALPGADPDLVSARIYRARLTCVSAAAHYGLAVLEAPSSPHLSVPRSRGRTPSPVREQHPARLHREDGVPVVFDERSPVVPLAHALARMLLCCPATHALVTIDCALARSWVTAGDIRAALPGNAPSRAGVSLRLADGRSQSPTETLARLALGAAGIRAEPAVHIPGVGFVDLLVEERVVVELDGFAYHSGRREYREDRRRDRELAALGLVALRFTFEDVVQDPTLVVRSVRAVLARRLPTPGEAGGPCSRG